MSLEKVSIDTVHVFVTSLGNHFMIEIAEVFDEGFRNSGIQSEIRIDKIPSLQPRPELMQLVIAPHEFFNLFLEPWLTPVEVLEVVQSVYMLSAEQPLTHWFEMACDRARSSLGILDITEHTAIEYRKRGIFTLHAPLATLPVLKQALILTIRPIALSTSYSSAATLSSVSASFPKMPISSIATTATSSLPASKNPSSPTLPDFLPTTIATAYYAPAKS